eukprot:scaffold32.g3804.t1
MPTLAGIGGGATTPMEIMYLSAASTLIWRSTTSSLGIIRKNPEVGLGVVGTYTLTWLPAKWLATSPLGIPVKKAIVQQS